MTRHIDRIPGGKADKRRPSDFNKRELARGTEHEMEHTNDRRLAQEIAMDHLAEDKRYYQKLALIEPNPRRPRKLSFAGYDFFAGPGGTSVQRKTIDTTKAGDYGADPLGDGRFRMVPSGDIVDFEERNRRLKKEMLDNPRRPPRGWFRRCMKGVEKSGARNPNAVCGSVWYHKLSEADRRRITRESEYAANPSGTRATATRGRKHRNGGWYYTVRFADGTSLTAVAFSEFDAIRTAELVRSATGCVRGGGYAENPTNNVLLIGGLAAAAALAFFLWPKKTAAANPNCPPGPDIIAYANSRGMAVTLFGGLPTSKPPAGYNAATAAAERIYNTQDCAFYKWESFDGAKSTWTKDAKLTAEFNVWVSSKGK